MKSRTTLVLVFVALVIGGLAAIDYYQGTSTQELQSKSKRVLDFQSKDIIGLKIDLTNHVYTLERSGDQWQLKQPLDVRANYSTVSSILDELEFAERNRSIAEKELEGLTPKDFGLQNPRVRLTLTKKKGSMILLIGNETPTKDAVYAQLQGKKNVLVVSKSIYERLDRTLDDRDGLAVIDFQPASATRIEIKSSDRVIEVAKSAVTTNAEPRWALTRPLVARADPRKVSELLSDLNGLRVTDFVSEDPKDIHPYQLDEPEREVTVWTGESGKTLQIGRASTNDPGKVYAKLKSIDSIYTVPFASVRKLAIQANDVRDAQVLAFSESDVHGIEVLHGMDKISFVRTDSTWSIAAPVVAVADDAAVEQLLRHLGGLSARQFTADVATDLDKYGLAAPLATVTLRGDGTNLLGQLLVGALDASNTVRFVKRVDEPFVYGVDTNIVGWLPTNYLALRARALVGLKADQITKLTIEKKPGKVTLQRDADKSGALPGMRPDQRLRAYRAESAGAELRVRPHTDPGHEHAGRSIRQCYRLAIQRLGRAGADRSGGRGPAPDVRDDQQLAADRLRGLRAPALRQLRVGRDAAIHRRRRIALAGPSDRGGRGGRAQRAASEGPAAHQQYQPEFRGALYTLQQ